MNALHLPGGAPAARRRRTAVRRSDARIPEYGVKRDVSGADKRHMIISDEQVRLALAYLQTTEAPLPISVDPSAGVSADLVERVRIRVAESPDVRFDRVAEARRAMEAGVSNEDVASKMIGRIISDSIR